MIKAGLVVAVLCASTAARAEDSPRDLPRVLYAGVEAASGVPPLVARRASERIATDLAADPAIRLLVVVEDDQKDVAPPPPVDVDRTAEARDRLVAARGALDKKDWPAAEEAALDAIALIAESAATLTDDTMLVDAHVVLGVARASRGDDAGARAAFAQALAFQPEKAPDLSRSRDAKAAWKKAQKELGKPGSIEITVTPPEAAPRVFVDGQDHGEAPVRIGDQLPGWHLVRVVAEGYRTFGGRAQVSPGATLPLEIALEPVVAPITAPDAVRAALRAELAKRAAGGLLDASAKPILGRLAERVGATHVVVGFVAPASKGYALRLFVYRGAGAKLVELDTQALDAELLELEARTLAASRGATAAIRDFPEERDITATLARPDLTRTDGGGLVEDGRRRRGPVDEDPARPVWKNPWVWIGVGGVVAAGVILGFVLASGEPPTGYDGMITLP